MVDATLPIDSIICGDNVAVMRTFPDECIDLTVTSPPYDNLRAYNGFSWDFEAVAQELYRVTKPGGVVVWVVGDATVNGSETGTSFRQALYFKEIGFNLHDTMIYGKINPSPVPMQNRYQPCFEYMFVFSKGPVPVEKFGRLVEPCKNPGGMPGRFFQENGNETVPASTQKPTGEVKPRRNIWWYVVGGEAEGHPAVFPDKLAEDHILSWSNEGDVVLDPFSGSGTTAKMALKHDRHFIGIDVSGEYCDIARQRLKNVQPVLSL